jgi:hypothetical protein
MFQLARVSMMTWGKCLARVFRVIQHLQLEMKSAQDYPTPAIGNEKRLHLHC